MTRNKPGPKPTRGGSAYESLHKATPVTSDRREGYSEERSIRQSKDGKPQVPKQNTVTGTFGSGKWTIPDLPTTVKKHITLKPSRYGSPYAYISRQDKHDFFKGLLPKSTCVLFDRIVIEASSLKKRLLQDPALANDGGNGHFCALTKEGSPSTNSNSSEESNYDGTKLDLYPFGPDENTLLFPFADSTDSSDGPSTTSDKSNADEVIDVGRVQNSQSGEIEYFVMNRGPDLLSINGIDVDTTEIAGPLPDFAVLELGRFSTFWWRTPAALDYMPLRSLKRKRGSEENEEESSRKAFKGNTDTCINLRVSPDSKNWLQEYRHRVELCKERPIRYTSLVTDLHPPHQHDDGELRDIDVILAIGAVWLGLIDAKVDFAYGNPNLFSVARSMRMVGTYAVKGTNHFLMPLVFNNELEAVSPESEEDTTEPLKPVFSIFQRGEEEKNQENIAAAQKTKQRDPGNKNKPPLSLDDQKIQNQENKGGIGHFVLAIAEKVDRDEIDSIKESPTTKKALVRLRFMDSAVGHVDKGVIRRVARNVVRNSGWLGDIWPCFDANEECWMDVLGQSVNRCGEHVVLNAWAYMLEISLATTRKGSLAKKTYDEVRQMIRLALQGKLDSMTIRAWMQNYKYAIHEPLSQLKQTQMQNPDLPDKVQNMQTVALNEDALNAIVDEMHRQEQATDRNNMTILGSVPVPVDDATTQQSASAHKVATGVPLPPASQDSIADFSDTSGIPASSIGSVEASTPTLPQHSYPNPRNWQERFVQSFTYSKALKTKHLRSTEDPRKDASIIRSSSNMADYDVILGIASIWEGLKRLGRAEFDFTYAGMDVFSPGGGLQEVGAVGGWNRFIMPVFFSPIPGETLENPGKGKQKESPVGHLLLCVAELVNDKPMTVQIQVYDSSVDTVPGRVIFQMAKAMIRRSGWLGTNVAWNRVEFRNPTMRFVPQQVGINTCGLHVILNAWATMLGIPIHPNNLRRGQINEARDRAFLERGLELVNLALEGFMDSATIQAFLNHYGYSVEQRFGDPARAVVPVNAVGMNLEKFRRTLEKRKMGEKLASARAEDRIFPDEAMAELENLGLSEDQAWTALVINDGNLERAAQWYLDSGELPRPEEALSPTTPDQGQHP